MKLSTFYLIIIFLCYGCKTSFNKLTDLPVPSYNGINEFKIFNPKKNKDWYFMDAVKDSIPGISLNSEIYNLIQDKFGQEVIVAVIDASVDIDHPGLKHRIWVNPNEIPNNDLDDDKNGYIDDLNGWNFLGHKDGRNTGFTSYEYTRIIRKYGSRYQDVNENEVNLNEKEQYKTYLKAVKLHNERSIYAKKKYKNDSTVYAYYENLLLKFKDIFKGKKYELSELDSMQNVANLDSVLKMNLTDLKTMIKYNISLDKLKESKFISHERIHKLLNINYDDRELRGDDENNLNDINYGNNIVNHNLSRMVHGTYVSGIISNIANRFENFGKKSNVKIMPIVISGYGGENDKDMALAIKYAVDNGASVINISSGKPLSMHKNWVHDAMLYAQKNNVIIIHGAGNDSEDLENEGMTTYPSDENLNQTEIVQNFLNIGASSFGKNGQLIAGLSNYGIMEVDLFAPGVEIYSMSPGGGNKFISGTSCATAVTTGIIALLRSYYPNLSAKQIKQIIMKSVVKYTSPNKVKTVTGDVVERPFSGLSKTGGILNARNAFVLAETF